MATIARTITEARNHILKRVNAENSSDWQTIVLQLLNDALVAVSTAHDWKFLRAYSTLTTTDATGLVSLPNDLDRILALHISGEEEVLLELQPQDFESAKEVAAVTECTWFCVRGYTQDDTSVAPRMQIEIFTAPATSTVFQLWYIKHVDEFLSTNLDIVPNLPPYIWDLVVRHATLEALKMKQVPNTVIQMEAAHFDGYLSMYKRREDMGAAVYRSISQRADVANHYSSRMR